MSTSRRLPDHRSGLVLDTRSLGRRAGSITTVQSVVEAPSDLGIEVIGVPAGSPIELDLRLESVIEGVLVSGTALAQARGECVRCLREVVEELEVEVQELFVHPGNELDEDDDEVSVLQADLIDLEPVLRDDIVLDLPFRPLCREDCAGLCPECGVRLDDVTDHHHDEPLDPRWQALAGLEPSAGDTYNDPGSNQGEEVSR